MSLEDVNENDGTGNDQTPRGEIEGLVIKSAEEVTSVTSTGMQPEEIERSARVEAVWQQMNKGVSMKTLNSIINKPSSAVNRIPQKKSSKASSSSWMTVLGMAPKKISSPGQGVQGKQLSSTGNGTNAEAKKLAAAALLAVKDAAAAAAAASGKGKVEITEMRDFVGEEVEVKKLIDANSKEMLEKGKAPVSAVDTVLEQIKKKAKLSVLDKTKKDWVEFKEENRGMEEELDAYKKSSDKYLDKVSFLQRADYREFERERDARLALHSKRKPDMREDP